MPGTYGVSQLRKFDRSILATRMPAADRVLETVPFCWLCPATSGRQTREHVFAQRLLREFPIEHTLMSPVRFTAAHRGSVVASQRGEFPATALVAGKVCAECNNGWMSQLETDARPYLLGSAAVVEGDSAEMLTRWFVKTAIVINVSQPYRLLWHSTRRHQVQTRVPDNVVVSLYRTATADVTWTQGAAITLGRHQAGLNTAEAANLTTNLTHMCRIQIGTLVGAVLAFPWQLSASTWTMPGELMWSDRRSHEVDLSDLPVMAEPFGDSPEFSVATSAFWSGTPRGRGR